MRTPAILLLTLSWVAVVAFLPADRACGAVQGVTGTATATVVQYNGIVEVQRDFSQESVPQTNPEPPATARARLDHLLQDGTVTAAGQVVALFAQPNLTGFGTPNDAGIDLGAFSDDSSTSWAVQGTVTETRTLVLGAGDLGVDLRFSNRGRAKSRILLSGTMLILASDAAKDLSDVEVRLRLQVTQQRRNQQAVELLTGTIALVGGPNGSIVVDRGAGAFANISPAIIDLAEIVPDLPLVRAIVFTGLELPYEYEAVVNETFDLALSVDTVIQTTPGTGAAATFGVPQEGLASVLARVKQSDVGARLADAISAHVDTTGAAYASTESDSVTASALPFSMCGVMGLEIAALAPVVVVCRLGRAVIRRRRIRPRSES